MNLKSESKVTRVLLRLLSLPGDARERLHEQMGSPEPLRLKTKVLLDITNVMVMGAIESRRWMDPSTFPSVVSIIPLYFIPMSC